MNKYIQYVNEFHEWNQIEIDFVNLQLKKHLHDNEENQTEIEHILDFLYSTSKDVSNIWYSTISSKAEKRTKKLMEGADMSDEIEGEDYEVVKSRKKDWFRIVKLISEKSYKREWKLMSHCVASYYWRDIEIFSLRDGKNRPHATMQYGEQVKGKGNGKIHPKYIKYIVEFLSSRGYEVRDSEMKNLWYIDVSDIKKELLLKKSPKLFKWKYLYEGDIDNLIDKKWDEYYSIKPVSYTHLTLPTILRV